MDKQECVNNCTSSQFKSKKCVIKYQAVNKAQNKEEKEITVQDVIIQSLESEFTSGEYDTSELDNGEEEVFEDNTMTITFTTSDTQRKNTSDNNKPQVKEGAVMNNANWYNLCVNPTGAV